MNNAAPHLFKRRSDAISDFLNGGGLRVTNRQFELNASTRTKNRGGEHTEKSRKQQGIRSILCGIWRCEQCHTFSGDDSMRFPDHTVYSMPHILDGETSKIRYFKSGRGQNAICEYTGIHIVRSHCIFNDHSADCRWKKRVRSAVCG